MTVLGYPSLAGEEGSSSLCPSDHHGPGRPKEGTPTEMDAEDRSPGAGAGAGAGSWPASKCLGVTATIIEETRL